MRRTRVQIAEQISNCTGLVKAALAGVELRKGDSGHLHRAWLDLQTAIAGFDEAAASLAGKNQMSLGRAFGEMYFGAQMKGARRLPRNEE